MKSEELLKAIGQIDDNLIEEKKQVKKFSIKSFRFKPVIKTAAVAVCALALVIGVAAPNMRMGSAKKADTEAEMYYTDVDMMEAPAKAEGFASNAAVMPQYKMEAESLNGMLEEYASSDFYRKTAPTQKLVYNANLSLETENFDEAYEALKNLVSDNDGYFEHSESYNGNYYSSNVNKDGYFTVRIPMANYDKFMNSIADSWHVAQRGENVSDISESYYDVVGRLDNLNIKRDRLKELLKSAQSMSDILEIENSLSNTEYEIEDLTRMLNGFNKQVDYATISINLCQVTQLGNTVASEGFGQRLSRAFKNGFRNFSEGIADFIVWASYNVIEIVIVIAAIVVIWRFKLIKKLVRWIKK